MALLADDDKGLPQPFWEGPYRELHRIEIPFVVCRTAA